MRGSNAETLDLACPVLLVVVIRNDDLRSTRDRDRGRRPRAAVVDGRSDA
jgi:hypothetical protein